MIVLTEIQKNKLLAEKKNFDFSGCDIVPVEIKNNFFILSEKVLIDEKLKFFFESFSDYSIRDILQTEFIKYYRP